MWSVFAVAFHSEKGRAGQTSFISRRSAIEKIGERALDLVEHPGRVASGAPEHSLDVLEDKLLVGVLVVHVLIVVRWIINIRIDFDLLHVSALIHSFDPGHSSVAGANMNCADGPVGSIGESHDPDRVGVVVSPERVTSE